MSAVLKPLRYSNGEVRLTFWCAGCNCRHVVRIVSEGGGDVGCWGWNGDMLNPTFTPSIKVEWFWGQKQEPRVCHSFVEDGNIRYLGDCTHEFAGQTFRLPLINDDPHDDPPES